MKRMKTREEMIAASIKTRQAIAAARREKVRELRDKGLTGPQIASELGVKLRTVYQDFSRLKREAENAENTE